MRGSHWSVTINNATETDHQQWAALKAQPWVKRAEGQLEQGESGTVHIQGMVVTEYGKFWQKLCDALPRAHVEVAKNKFALQQYVHKTDTRIGTVETVERPATRIATQEDLQNEIVMQVRTIAPSKYPERWAASEGDLQVFMQHHGFVVRSDADWWIDQAVNALIRRGYFGVEFTMANNQIRSAFKRYLDSIIIRNLSADLYARIY